MNEKPILFNSEMVNAILSGRKTQTRRIISEKALHLFGVAASSGECHPIELCDQRSQSYYLDFCPLGKPGDQLWVREAFAAGLCTESTLAYRATHKPEDLEEGWGETIKWTPSIHMPRWASRINLLITGVRVERLNTISTGDAMAEGYPVEREATGGSLDAWLWFRELWDGIYPDNTFEVNPWCWVIEFERMEAK
ncbi:hypothetical protein [Yersinia enterocolitica]|uniref:hypothetical protein n=1 Tax=Yersinia enterocolitica TaxID=630 RepID=UPI0028B8B628|nr:hypothetical protein [Yersinia enterocolitica]ELI8285626.1 hypothetical protein [Yersinia enterocolitica]HDL6748671.1 hypothetical protein [Yersinia enterocolitica]HEN3233918.1 hypothetical protein [Yersinia enterocolitica]HEN3438771.1 hypothetical protein [Yersinia enterocolitica]